MMKQNSGDNVKVFIRVRPLNEKEKETLKCVDINDNSIAVRTQEDEHRFSFDHVFHPHVTQKEVYQNAGKDVVQEAFKGFNGTVFAYGQTSSGKTHTCIGPDFYDPERQGILPRMIHHLFQKIQSAPPSIQFRIKLSMVEIYMEKIKDLFDMSKNDLKIREKVGKGIYIQDVTEEYVACIEQTLDLVKKGINHRSVGQTNMNDTSSRSHMAFIITLYQNNLKDASAKSGKIILVDLAGSQKVNKTGAYGKLLDQAKQINKSLAALGNVINSLTDSKTSHVPYRDSKLTRLLQESLGGNSKTHLIINCSPSSVNDFETLSSLRFGFRAKNIKNKPKVNRQYTVAELLLLLEKAEKRIQQLQVALRDMPDNPNKSFTHRSTKKVVQNLLDSDHPILQTQEEEQSEKQPEIQINEKTEKISNKKLRVEFESEYPSDEEDGTPVQISKRKIVDKQVLQTISEQKQLLNEEIQFLNMEKVEITREIDIIQQKYELLSRDNRSSQSKNQFLQKENQKLLEKLIEQTSKNQANQQKIADLTQQINEYEEKILKIASIQEKQNSNVSKVFGVNKDQSPISNQIKKMIEKVKQKQKQNEVEKMALGEVVNENKNERIEDLQKRNKILEEEIKLFNNLEESKEAFIKQKLDFNVVKERIYKDLQNRIEKVLELQQRLDEEQEKAKFYQQMIKMEESDKNRKILLLQKQINQISEHYYVLKGQQGSWLKNNSKAEYRLGYVGKNWPPKITSFQLLKRRFSILREEIESLKMQIQDMETNPHQQSFLDMNFNDENNEPPYCRDSKKMNIVKVVRSSTFRIPKQST